MTELEQALESLGRAVDQAALTVALVGNAGSDDSWTRDKIVGINTDAPPQSDPPIPPCLTAQRQGDEWACRCGLRWAIGEQRPHCELADGR